MSALRRLAEYAVSPPQLQGIEELKINSPTLLSTHTQKKTKQNKTKPNPNKQKSEASALPGWQVSSDSAF